jgi:hypothetical protein
MFRGGESPKRNKSVGNEDSLFEGISF